MKNENWIGDLNASHLKMYPNKWGIIYKTKENGASQSTSNERAQEKKNCGRIQHEYSYH